VEALIMTGRSVLVDGYNLIGSLSTLDPHRLECLRSALLDRLDRYARVRGHRVTVVFDGADHPVARVARRPRSHVVEAWSAAGETADDWIVEEARVLRGACVVVTNDRGLTLRCLRLGAVVATCAEFDAAVTASGQGRKGFTAETAEKDERGRQGRAAPAVQPAGEDLDAWERFAATVEPIRRDAAPPPRPGTAAAREEPAVPPSPQAPLPLALDDLAAAMLDVPEGMAEAKAGDDTDPLPRPREHATREQRRRRHVLEDL
jgi:predicted RNA-binding protein with PIN domain